MFLASTFDSGYWLFTVSRFQDTCPFFHRKGFSLKKLSCRMCRSFWRIQCKSNWMSCTMLCAIIKNDRTALDRSLVFTRIRLWWLEWGDVHVHVVKIQAIFFFFLVRVHSHNFSGLFCNARKKNLDLMLKILSITDLLSRAPSIWSIANLKLNDFSVFKFKIQVIVCR